MDEERPRAEAEEREVGVENREWQLVVSRLRDRRSAEKPSDDYNGQLELLLND